MKPNAVHQIIEALGQEIICSALGVGLHSIRYAKNGGVFPASWYGRLKPMCDAAEVPCSFDAFNWKTNTQPEADGSGT